MLHSHRTRLWTLSLLGGVAALAGHQLIADGPKTSVDAPLERTRKQVRMLDDLYKTAVVLITDKYVNSENDAPAGAAAKALFGAMRKKGWHDVRLVDASGEPLVTDNAPADDFERDAVAALLEGQPGYERVVEKDGKRWLRSATPVPVVLKKCALCHPNYNDVPEGRPIGALSYTLEVE